MKKISLLLILLVVTFLSASATIKSNKDTKRFRYDIECAGTGAQGTYLVKVWSYSRCAKVATAQCIKNAVHGIIFKGVTGGNGCVSQRALASNPGVEQEYATYFENFFSDNNGEYQKYASAAAAAPETVKVGRDYKVGMVVSVNKDALRKALEEAGVIKGLSNGF